MSSSNTTYNTSFDQTRSLINSPHLGPPAASLSPATFRTNVNRAKSKRWVEAKTVDYAGGGWGDDSDFDDEDDYDPPPMSGKGSGLQRSNSFDRGDDGMSPVIGNRGNGSAVPRIETTNAGITQPLPPTPLELEERERALRGQSPPPHPKHQYPMQPKPQLSALPYMTSATSSPARTPPLPVYGSASSMQAGSFADPRRLPDTPVKDRIPPPLGPSPNMSAIPSPPPPLQTISAPGRDVVPPPLGMGPGPSPILQPYSNFAPSPQSFSSTEKPLPIRKDSPPTSGDEITRANPSPFPTWSPSPPPVPRKAPENPQYPSQRVQALVESPPPPPPPPSPPAKPVEASNQEVKPDSDEDNPAFFGLEGGGVKLNDNQNDFQGQQMGHVDAYQGQYPPYSPPREAAYSPPSVPPPQLASPELVRRFVRPAEIMARMNQAKDKEAGEARQEGFVNMSPPESITSIPYSNGPNNMGRQSTDSLSPPGVKGPERIRELRENLGRPSSRQSNSEDSRPGSRSGSRPNSRNGSRPSSRQGRVPTPSPYPPPTGALPAVPGSPAVPVAQHFQHPMDTVVAGQNSNTREEKAMSWDDDILSGYTNSPEEVVAPQHPAPFQTPPQAGDDAATSGPIYPTNHSTPDPKKPHPVQGPRMESVGFRSMVDHAFTRQDTLVPTPISPHRENLNSSPGDMVSPILPRDIPLPKSSSPPIISTPAPPPKSPSPPAVSAPVPPPKSPSPPVNAPPPPPPKSPSPPILTNPTPRPKSMTPPGAATRLENPALALSMDLSRSSSPINSMGPERSATPIVPPVVPDGVEVELDQVTPDTAGPQNREAEKPKVSDNWPSASGLDIPLQPVGNGGDSVASSPEKDDLDRFLGELVRANTPAPRSRTTSPQLPSNRASMDNANQVVPPVPAVPEHPSPPQQLVNPVPQSQFHRPGTNRESVGVLSLYDSYWTDESVPPPPPIQPKNPRRPSAALEAEVAKQELEALAQTSRSGSEQRPSSPQPIPSHPTVEPPTPDRKSGIALPPVRIPENNFHADSPLTTPASTMDTPDSELMEMMIARKHYLARTQTGLSTKSDSTGRGISDDVMLRVKGDEMMFEKPDDIVTPDVEFKGKAKEIVIGSEVENVTQDGKDQGVERIDEAEVTAPARVIGPDSEGMEAIAGPTKVPRPESPKGEGDGEKTPMQSDFARELVNQFSRPQTLMLKDTMPMPSGVLVMPPMPPKEEGEEVAPEVVDFSTKDDEEELVVSETGTIALDKSRTHGSAHSVVHPDQHPPKDNDVGKMSQYLHPRDIARLPKPEDRIAAYDQATQAIAQSKTGLNDWINWMMEENGGEALLRAQVEQRPETAIQALKKSTSRAFMGVGRPSVDDAPNQPSQPYQHQQVAQPPPQAQGQYGGEDGLRINTTPQAPGASSGQHVSPVVDKAREFFNRLKKVNNKDGQDGSLPGAQPSQKGQQYPPPPTAGSLRTLASSGSFQNSFTASGLVGAPSPNGNHKRGSQGQVTPPQSVSHQGQPQGHPQNPNQYPQGPQGVYGPPQGLPQDPSQGPPQGPHHPQAGLPQPPVLQEPQPLPQQQQQGYQQRPQQQGQKYGQFNNGGQIQQGLMGPPLQRGHPQPDFTERFPQASPSPPPPPPPPPPPVKDRPPQLVIPTHHQQLIPEGHPLIQSQPPEDAPIRAPPQPPAQTVGDRLPAGNRSTLYSHRSEESISHAQSPLTVLPPIGNNGQKTYSSPPTPQHSFPKRTDSLLSRAHRQNSGVNSPVASQTPGRADSLTFVHERLPPLQQSSTRSDSLVSSIHPGGPASRSDSITSSVMNSPTHPTRSDSLNFAHNGHPQQQNPGWTGGPQGPPTIQGTPQYQSGPPQPPTVRAVQAEDLNAMSRSFSDRLPNNLDNYDHAGVARSQSHHVGPHPPNPNEGYQQGFMYNRPRGPPDPIQENPQSPGRPDDDDLYAPPAHLRQQLPPTQHDQRGNEVQQRPQQPFDDARERLYAVRPGPGSQPVTLDYPSQGPQGPSMVKTGPEPQHPIEQNRFPGHPSQGPNQMPPQGYQNGPQGQQFQPRGPYQGHGPIPQGQYQPGFQPRAAGYQTAQPPQPQQPPPQGQFRRVSPSAMGAPGSLLRQHGQPQNQPEPEPGIKRNSTGLVKTLSNVSGRRQSTDAGSSEFQGRNSQSQYEPSTSSSQEKRRSSFFSNLSAKVEKTGRASPSEKQDPKPIEKSQRRGTSFLKLKSKEPKDKRNSGDGNGKPAHKKGFSIDVFGRTGSMLGKLTKSTGPSSKHQQQQQRPPQQQQQGPPQKFNQQQFPQQGPPQHRQSQPVGPRPGVGPQNAYAANAQAHYTPQQQPQPQQPQGPPGQWNGPSQQVAHPQGPVGQASPPQIKTPEPVSQPPPNKQQPLPRPNSQEPRYDPVPIPSGYGRPQGEFYGAHNPGQPGFTHQQQPQPPQLQFPPSQSPEPSLGAPTQPGQQGYSQEHSGHGGDMHQNRQGREHRLSVDYRHSPDLSRQGSGTHRTPPPPSLSPQLSRQGTQASHTRSVSPQISNIDAHSVRNAPMSPVSENPMGVVSLSSAQGPPPSSEREMSTSTGYVSPPHISPQSSVRDSNRYASPPPPQPSHTPPPQLAYPVASPLGLQQAMSEMEYEITRRSPTTQPMVPPPIPAKQPPTPPPANSSSEISQAVKPSSPAPAVGSSINVESSRSPSPPSTTAPMDKGKTAGTFYAEDSNSSSSKIDTPTRAVSPGQPMQEKIPEVDYSQEKIAIHDGIEVEPSPRRDDSDDEPVMSATAYPGQAWDPSYLGW